MTTDNTSDYDSLKHDTKDGYDLNKLARGEAKGGEPADERAAFVQWLSSTYPHSYDEDDAQHYWMHDHVTALAWQARAALATKPAESKACASVGVEPGDSLPRYILWDSKHPDYPVEWSNPGRPPRDGEIGFFRHDIVNELMDEQRAALQSKACASVGAVTEGASGWKWVPIEPTDAMIDATYTGQHCSDIWRDMIAAAPAAAVPESPAAITQPHPSAGDAS